MVVAISLLLGTATDVEVPKYTLSTLTAKVNAMGVIIWMQCVNSHESIDLILHVPSWNPINIASHRGTVVIVDSVSKRCVMSLIPTGAGRAHRGAGPGAWFLPSNLFPVVYSSI